MDLDPVLASPHGVEGRDVFAVGESLKHIGLFVLTAGRHEQ
jgi:hypothetical protein